MIIALAIASMQSVMGLGEKIPYNPGQMVELYGNDPRSRGETRLVLRVAWRYSLPFSGEASPGNNK
jgi:hypothetical protein